MLIIRDEQIAAMTQPARERYREVVRQRLLRAHPDECALMTHEELGAMISAAQLNGVTYGLKTDEQMCQRSASASIPNAVPRMDRCYT